MAAKEQMEQVFAALLQEKDEQRNLINILGGILDQNAAEIARVLEDHPAKFKVLTQPTIRRQIEKARGTIRKILGHSPDE